MGTTDVSSDFETESQRFARPFPEYVDWLVGLVIAVGGIALTVGGSVLTFVVDRDLIEADIQSGEITVVFPEPDLTEPQKVEFVLEIVNWTGLGLLLTGIGLVLFAVSYVVVRHRNRERVGDEERVDSYRSYAVLGAVATAVLSFVPFSQVLGGAIAGYLEHKVTGRSTSIGALAGFLSVIPALVILVFVAIGLYSGFATVAEAGLGIVLVTGMLLVLIILSAYGAGLGAVGGFIGGRLADNE